MGGLATSSKHDPLLYTAAARRAFRDHFIDLVDPGRVLDEGERRRRAEAARRLHYVRLAFRSAAARAKKNKAKGAAKEDGSSLPSRRAQRTALAVGPPGAARGERTAQQAATDNIRSPNQSWPGIAKQRIKELRNRRGLSQVGLAVEARVDIGTISRLERGLHAPNPRTLQKVCAALHVAVEDVLEPPAGS